LEADQLQQQGDHLMGFALGQKIDARLKAMEDKCAALSSRVEALNTKADGLTQRCLFLIERIEALEAKRGPGRPKATDGK
jgi:acetyl-CoA carboxylase alpha subunit